MSTQRNLARLPLDIFAQLVPGLDEDQIGEGTEMTAEQIRNVVATKLQRALGATTAGSLVCHSPIDLVCALDPLLTVCECEELQHRVSRACAPTPVTALSLWQHPLGHIATGIDQLDLYLRGGVGRGTVTELVGAPATGKTQLALQLTCRSSSSIFLDTEKKVSLERWREIANGKSLENATLHVPANLQELQEMLKKDIEEEIILRNVSLIVLDSIAAPARRGVGSAAAQATLILQIAQTLKRMAHQYQLAVVVVNQVASSGEQQVAPKAALGTAWYHCVATRLQLEHPDPSHPHRRVSVTKSHYVGPSSPMTFQVTQQGLVEVNDQTTPSFEE